MPFPKLKSKAVLSPMSGVTDVAFRALAAECGAGMTYTEFVHSTAIVRGNQHSLNMLKTDPKEKPVAVQLFGNSINDVVEAAQQVEKKFDVIDVNCGCPAWKVIKTGAGSALLKDPDKIATFINKLVSAVQKPVTVKIRKGIDESSTNAIEVAKKAEDAGAAAIAIHGRTQKQAYQGQADWNIIKKVKEAINIPVIGNGDVFSPEVFQKRLEESNVDAIMIARGAIGNPYIFQQIKDYGKKGSYSPPDKFTLLQNYLKKAKKYHLPFSTMKQQAIQFTKGLENSAKLRASLASLSSLEQLQEVLS